jgi:hypothetical protein
VNKLYVFGKLYWILRDVGKAEDRHLSKGFMRQTSSPWLTGSGIQFRIGKYVLQIGTCKNPQRLHEDDGLLYALQGRIMDSKPKDIRDWR